MLWGVRVGKSGAQDMSVWEAVLRRMWVQLCWVDR